MQSDENDYCAANLARSHQGLRPFNGIEEFRRGLSVDQVKSEKAQALRDSISAAERHLADARHRAIGPVDFSAEEKAIATSRRELLKLGGAGFAR